MLHVLHERFHNLKGDALLRYGRLCWKVRGLKRPVGEGFLPFMHVFVRREYVSCGISTATCAGVSSSALLMKVCRGGGGSSLGRGETKSLVIVVSFVEFRLRVCCDFVVVTAQHATRLDQVHPVFGVSGAALSHALK